MNGIQYLSAIVFRENEERLNLKKLENSFRCFRKINQT